MLVAKRAQSSFWKWRLQFASTSSLIERSCFGFSSIFYFLSLPPTCVAIFLRESSELLQMISAVWRSFPCFLLASLFLSISLIAAIFYSVQKAQLSFPFFYVRALVTFTTTVSPWYFFFLLSWYLGMKERGFLNCFLGVCDARKVSKKNLAS